MRFEFTPEEAQQAANALARYFQKQKMSVKVEKAAWPEAPYRTTLVASKGGLDILVEAQGSLDYSKSLKELATWIAARRHYAELFLATHPLSSMNAGFLAELRFDGVGLLVVDDSGTVSESLKARNPALVVTPDPTLKYGTCASEVKAAVKKFNEIDRKDGLRDMCELVERETEALLRLGIRKGWITIPESSIKDKDWSDQINTLASRTAYNAGRHPLVSSTFKDDLHSFRGARNLIDHKVKGKRDDVKRQKQFAERMMQGPRLTAELKFLQRKIM